MLSRCSGSGACREAVRLHFTSLHSTTHLAAATALAVVVAASVLRDAGVGVRVLRIAPAPRGPRGGVEDSMALQERSMLCEGAHAGGLAARVCCGIGAVRERALLARVRRDRLGDA